MALSWVKVVRKGGGGLGDPVYLGGHYTSSPGGVGDSFRTDTGQRTFETLAADLTVTWCKVATVDSPNDNSKEKPIVVELDPGPCP